MSARVHRIQTLATLVFVIVAHADDVLYRYEGDVLPYDPSAGWFHGTCENSCTETIEDGYFILRWPGLGDWPSYGYRIAQPPVLPPPSLWVEWRFRSNHPMPPHSYTCDADFAIQYRNIVDLIFMYGDAVVSFSGSDFVWPLPNNEFRTYRFESPDGVNYWFSVDGLIFRLSYDEDGDNGSTSIRFLGAGGCLDDWIPNKENAWDFIRFGTIGYGERIVASHPPAGFVDARVHPAIDRFTITFDSPNYVYLDEITVEVTPANQSRDREGAEADPNPERKRRAKDPALALGVLIDAPPIVTKTRRLDNGPTDVVEIVLDRPIPYNATTRFTFDDGTLAQTLNYTFAPGDADGDGRADLADFASFQNCFGLGTVLSNPAPCVAFDFDADGDIDLADFYGFQRVFAGL